MTYLFLNYIYCIHSVYNEKCINLNTKKIKSIFLYTCFVIFVENFIIQLVIFVFFLGNKIYVSIQKMEKKKWEKGSKKTK